MDAWVDAYVKMDPDRAAQFWDASPQMMYAENGEKYANWDPIHSAIKGMFSRPMETLEFKFEQKDKVPLSHNSAHFFISLDMSAKLKSGQVFRVRGFSTALLVKKNGTWKILLGHESWKPVASK